MGGSGSSAEAGRGTGVLASLAFAPPTRRWTAGQLDGAVHDVADGRPVPPSCAGAGWVMPADTWAALEDAQRALYAVRVSVDPPMTLADAALALGWTRGATEERWMQVRMLTECPSLEQVRMAALSEVAPPVAVPVPEHVTDTDLVLLARRKAYEGLAACDPAARPREFKDLTAAVATAMRTSHEIAAAPLELRRRDDREGLRELAQGLLTEMAKRGVSLHATTAPVIEGEVVRESASETQAAVGPLAEAPADTLANDV